MLNLLRTNRDLRWLFIAQVISFMGDWFTFVAVAGLVKDATGSELLVSVAYVAFSLPSFLASPIAGPVVDRYDRRKLLIIVSAMQAFAALGLLTASADMIWPIFVCQGTISALAAFVKPAIDSGIPNLVRSPEELRLANGLFGSVWGVMLALGAGIGGFFAQAFGRDAAFVADAVTFVLALGLFALIRRPMQAPQHAHRAAMRPLDDMAEAVRYARRDRVVLALIASKASFAIGSGAVSQLPVLATDVYGSNDVGTGILMAARGVGVALGPLIAARYTRGKLSMVLRVCGFAGVLYAVLYVTAAWVPALLISAVFIAFAHLGGGAQWTLSTYGLQLQTPDEIRGRVMAGDFAIVTLIISLSALAAGLMSEQIGPQWTITLCAVAAGVAGLAYLAWTRPIAARLDSEELAASLA